MAIMKMNLIQRLIKNHRRRAGIKETSDIKDTVYAALKDKWYIKGVESYRQQTSCAPQMDGSSRGYVDTLYGVVFYNRWPRSTKHHGYLDYYRFSITVDCVCYSITQESAEGWLSDRAMTKLATEFARICYHESMRKYVQVSN